MKQVYQGTASESHQCFCIGPQNGQPLCPCRMKGVVVQNGRYVEIIDHGPVKEAVTLPALEKCDES